MHDIYIFLFTLPYVNEPRMYGTRMSREEEAKG